MTDTTAATPAARPTRARRLVLVAAVAAVALVAWALGRDSGPTQGPLSAPGVEYVSIFQHPGDQFGYGFPVAYNTGTQTAVIDRIRLVEPTPGLEVVDTRLGGPDRKLLALDATFAWPSDEFTDQRPVKGFRLPPATQAGGERGVELLFGLRVGKLGSYQARAAAVDYTVNGKRHTAVIHRALKVCVIPKPRPLEGDCGQPTGLDDPNG